MDHEYQKYNYLLGEQGWDVIFKFINRWDVIKISDNIIPRGNCIRKKAIHVSKWFTSYFMESITVFMNIQGSALSRRLFFLDKKASDHL